MDHFGLVEELEDPTEIDPQKILGIDCALFQLLIKWLQSNDSSGSDLTCHIRD